jgi:hypothetical protein
MTIGHLAMLMGFAMTAQWAFYRFDSSRGSSLLDQSHISLTHHQELFRLVDKSLLPSPQLRVGEGLEA